jgi:hypothetical protein
LSLQGEFVLNQEPHRPQPFLWGHREPKIEINFRHLVEGTRYPATPGAAALLGASRSSRLAVVHGRNLAHCISKCERALANLPQRAWYDTRHTVFEPSSLTKSAPSLATVTPTGRPQTSPSGLTNPVRKSSYSPVAR